MWYLSLILKDMLGLWTCDCPVSDVHNFIGVATKRHTPLYHPRKIIYRSYKNFDDERFADDIASAPFHVAEIFDDVDDMSSYVSKLLGNIIDSHAPLKCKTIKCNSVPFAPQSHVHVKTVAIYLYRMTVKLLFVKKKYPNSLMIISVVLVMVLDLTTVSRRLRMQ